LTASVNGNGAGRGAPKPSSPHWYAEGYCQAGLSVVPIKLDGSKRPDLPSWDEYQGRLPTEAELRRWFARAQPPGVGVVCGKVSGGLELLDFDLNADVLFPRWLALVDAERPGLAARLCVVRTPRRPAGYHVRYRVANLDVPGNDKLAERHIDDPKTGKRVKATLVETRGEGGQALAPGCPSECHPAGGVYEHIAGPPLTALETVEADDREVLIRCARSLDEVGAPEGWRFRAKTAGGPPPGDDFDLRGPDWSEILEPHGWVCMRTEGGVRYWRRPGKDHGSWSATTGRCTGADGAELLRIFSTNADPFEDGKCYGKFRVFALLNHNGDQAAAARELGGQSRGRSSAAPKPPPVYRPLEPYRPFPTERLPGPLRSFVEQAAAAIGQACDPAYIAVPALVICGSLIGNTHSISLKNTWSEPSVVWAVIVGDSGTLKTPALKQVVKPLFALQRRLRSEARQAKKRYEEAKAAWDLLPSAKKKAAKPPQQPAAERRLLCSDATIEKLAELLEDSPQGLLLWRDELDAWLQSFKRYKSGGGSDRPQWLEMHSAGPLIYDRKTGEKQSIMVPAAAVSIVGGIQPGVLAAAMDDGARASGLAARLLLAWPPKRKKRWTDADLDPEVEKAYANLLDQLLNLPCGYDGDGERRPWFVKLSAQAKALWVRFYNEWAEEQAAVDGDLASAFSKLEAYAARLTLLHHVVTNVARGQTKEPVAPESVEAAVALTRWFVQEARRIYSSLGESPEERDVRRLVEFIRLRGGSVTVRELHRSNQTKYRAAGDAEAALQALVDAGLGDWVIHAPGPDGGRPPSKTFTLKVTRDRSDRTADAEDGAAVTGEPGADDATQPEAEETWDPEGSVTSVTCHFEGAGEPDAADDLSPTDEADASECPF
jgi:hypothetical protein